jgi:hypothetical protein
MLLDSFTFLFSRLWKNRVFGHIKVSGSQYGSLRKNECRSDICHHTRHAHVELYRDTVWVCCHLHFCFHSFVSWLWKYNTLKHQTCFVDAVLCSCLFNIRMYTKCLAHVSSLKLNGLWLSLVLGIFITSCFRSIIGSCWSAVAFCLHPSLSNFLQMCCTENLCWV